MLYSKWKRVIATVLVVCMTFCSQGFSVLATSIDSVVKEKETEKANPICYSHGTYFTMGKRIGTFGYSVKKK